MTARGCCLCQQGLGGFLSSADTFVRQPEGEGGRRGCVCRSRPFSPSADAAGGERPGPGHGDGHGGALCARRRPRAEAACGGRGAPGAFTLCPLSPQFTAVRHSLVTPSASDDAAGAAPAPPPPLSCPTRCPPGTGPWDSGRTAFRTYTYTHRNRLCFPGPLVPGRQQRPLCVSPRPAVSACPNVPGRGSCTCSCESLVFLYFLLVRPSLVRPSLQNISPVLLETRLCPYSGRRGHVGRNVLSTWGNSTSPGARNSCGTPTRDRYPCVPDTQGPVSLGVSGAFP